MSTATDDSGAGIGHVPSHSIAARSTHDGPWCWESKAARRLIRDTFDATGNVCAALSLYGALVEVASNKQAATFDVAQAYLGRLAGLSARWVRTLLPKFCETALVKIQGNRLPGTKAALPSTFTLLRCTYGTEFPTSGTDGGKAPVPGSEESPEESPKEGKVETKKCTPPGGGGDAHSSEASEGLKAAIGSRTNPRPLPKDLAEVFTAAESLGIGAETARAFVHFQKFHAWRMNGSSLVDWHKALGHFAAADHKRRMTLKLDGLTNSEFWSFVDAEGIEHATANGWIRAMEKKHWKLPNPANGRLEPIRDFKAALRAFVGSDLNQIFESIGHYDE